MKITIERNLLLNKLNVVSHALPAKSPMPVLTGIKIEVAEDSITFIASNSDISIRTKLGYEDMVIEETGTIVVQGKMFCDIIRTLNSKDVELYTEGNVLRIKANKGTYKLNLMEANSYPNINFELGADNPTPLKFSASTFGELIKNVIFSASQNEKKPILTGVNFEYGNNGNQVVATATDSFRLSRMTSEVENVNPFNITVPNASLNELLKCIDSKDELAIYLVGSTIRFTFEDVDFVSRMLDADYPNTSRLITSDFATEIEINKEEVLNCADRIMILSPTGSEKEKALTYNVIGLRQESNTTAVLEISNASAGEAKEEITINVIKPCKEMLNIKFSGKYFIEGLRSFKSDKVKIKFNGAVRPFIMEGDSDKGLIQLILPVRM